MKSFTTFLSDDKFYADMHSELQENTLYSTDAERDELLKDKDKVAEAFIFNFLGILGMLNARTHQRDAAQLRKYFMSDKKMQLANIGEDNHDLSLSLKLAQEAGFFKNDVVVQQITRFLVKLKLGQISEIDSKIVGGWMDALKPEFIRHIKDPQVRALISEFIKDKGETIDVSAIAVLMKKKMRKLEMGGDFVPFAKKFSLKVRTPQDVSSTLATLDASTAGKRAQKAQATTTTSAPATGTPIADPLKPVASALSTPAPSVPVVEPVAEPDKPFFDSEKLYNDEYLIFWFDIYAGVRNKGGGSITERYLKRKGYLTDAHAVKSFREHIVGNTQIQNLLHQIYEPLQAGTTALKPVVEKLLETINHIGLYEEPLKLSILVNDLFSSLFTDYRTVPAIRFPRMLYNAETASVKGAYEYVYGSVYYETEIDEIADKLEKSNLTDKNKLIRDLFAAYQTSYSWTGGSNLSLQDYTKPDVRELHANFFIKFVGLMFPTDMSYEDSAKFLGANGFKFLENVFANLDSIFLVVPTTFAGSNIRDTFIRLRAESEEVRGRGVGGLPASTRKGFLNELFPSSYYAWNSWSIDAVNLTESQRAVIEFYLEDILEKGYENSVFISDSIDGFEDNAYYRSVEIGKAKDRFIKIVESMNFDIGGYLDKHQGDLVIGEMVVASGSKFRESLSPEQKRVAIRGFYDSLVMDQESYFRKDNSGLTKDSDAVKESKEYISYFSRVLNHVKDDEDMLDEAVKIFVESIKSNPTNHTHPNVFGVIARTSPSLDKKHIVEIFSAYKAANVKIGFGSFDTGSARKRSRSGTDVKINSLGDIINDLSDSDIADYIFEQLDRLPDKIVGEVKDRVVGIGVFLNQIKKGDKIKTFGEIDSKRLKIMLAMNDIAVGDVIKKSRRKKGETWSQFIKRSIEEGAQDYEAAPVRVEEYDTDLVNLTNTYNKLYRNGRHGGTHAIFKRAFTSDLEFPEFAKFRETNFGDGTVVPAFHSSGGIAAQMILRFGFAVLKSSDKSVVGRMLGDGIYFTNVLDKALQYCSNGGYARDYGTSGYVFELDVNLGKRATDREGPDYRTAGHGNDNIVSPEWVVRDPKKQIAIRKVYEVELSSKRYMQNQGYLQEGTGIKSFKTFLNEAIEDTIDVPLASYRFRDGMIPTFKYNERLGNYDMELVDFDEVIEKRILPPEMIEFTSQGPVVVFKENIKEFAAYDVYYVDLLEADAFKQYRDLFLATIAPKD